MTAEDNADRAQDKALEAQKEAAKREYRGQLAELQEKMQTEYDKTVLLLSGGAFTVSGYIIKELMGSARGSMLVIVSWAAWIVSVTAVLASFYTSALAMERAIQDVDNNAIGNEPGGSFDISTRVFNITSGSFFVLGVVLFTIFLAYNF